MRKKEKSVTRETEVRLELIEDALRVSDPALFHARHEFSLEGFHALGATLGTIARRSWSARAQTGQRSVAMRMSAAPERGPEGLAH